MLTHPLYEKLAQLRLSGMLLGLKEQMNSPKSTGSASRID
jgi:hypothetical protein